MTSDNGTVKSYELRSEGRFVYLGGIVQIEDFRKVMSETKVAEGWLSKANQLLLNGNPRKLEGDCAAQRDAAIRAVHTARNLTDALQASLWARKEAYEQAIAEREV